MHCPRCSTEMNQVEIQEVPVEQCPECTGVWLDAGELELIAQRECSAMRESWIVKLWNAMSSRKQSTSQQNIPPQ
jgi:Zn-finger nucleic acid-binding protein